MAEEFPDPDRAGFVDEPEWLKKIPGGKPRATVGTTWTAWT
jgi:hypothetical protein